MAPWHANHPPASFNCSSYDSSAGYTCYDNNTYTVFTMNPNMRTRFRIINAGAFAEFTLSVDNHSLSVIEADGTLVEPLDVHRLPIHVAQRYSIVLKANQSASTNYWLRAAMVTLCFTGNNNVLDPTTKAVISYTGNNTVTPTNASIDWRDAYPVRCKDLDPTQLVPSIPSPPPPATRFYRIDFSFGIGAYQMDYAKVNGTTWAPLTNTSTLMETVDGLNSATAASWASLGLSNTFASNQFVVGLSNDTVEVVDILLYSLDEGSHPFHLHGHDFVSGVAPLSSLVFPLTT